MTAYLGKVLWVDLAAHQCREEHISDDIYAQYLSGIGLAANLLYERIPALADPLGPDNVLAFVLTTVEADQENIQVPRLNDTD